MRTLLITSALLLSFAATQARAQCCPECRCGCPCDPGFNWYDWSAIDFTTGLPYCLTQGNGCCSPFELYYARSIAGAAFSNFTNNGFGNVGPGGFNFTPSIGFGPAGVNVNPGIGVNPAAVGPAGFMPPRPVVAPTTPIMHKAGPPVVDAVDPFTVSTKDKESVSNVINDKTPGAKKAANAKPAEFELPRVSSNSPATGATNGKDTTGVYVPPPPPSNAQQERSIVLPAPRMPMLPAPRFVPSRGHI